MFTQVHSYLCLCTVTCKCVASVYRVHKAAKEFGINLKRVREWSEKYDELKRHGGGVPGKWRRLTMAREPRSENLDWLCLFRTTVEYRQSAPPPYFHARMARKRGGGGGRINGSDRFCTRGAPPILISAPRPWSRMRCYVPQSTVCVQRPWRTAAVDK